MAVTLQAGLSSSKILIQQGDNRKESQGSLPLVDKKNLTNSLFHLQINP